MKYPERKEHDTEQAEDQMRKIGRIEEVNLNEVVRCPVGWSRESQSGDVLIGWSG